MSVLSAILKEKLREIQSASALRPLETLRAEANSKRHQPLGFVKKLRLSPFPAIIAEVKLASPSKGIIRSDLRAVDIALGYAAANAACISVLTDEKYFHGSLKYLQQIRTALPEMPLLRKDFIIDEYQIFEARLAGADAILLIAAALDDEQIFQLAQSALNLSLDILLEIHNEEELARALALLARLPQGALDNIALGINNRDLSSFVTDLAVSERLVQLIPTELRSNTRLTLVSESGIFTADDIKRLRQSAIRSFLIGESLVKTGSPEENLRTLTNESIDPATTDK
ncbi:MAG: indole-3-glycerol phosphate synthase TrpC [bacterium]|nr:indole-3-glycerol phosphate synthase TrpC [bacterium]